MEQAQSYSIKINTETNEILSMGQSDRVVKEIGTTIYSVNWLLIEPFFNQTKHHRKYSPIIVNNIVTKFKLKEEFESEIVTNTDEPIVKSLRPYENFIADCKIQVTHQPNKIVLSYNAELFDNFTNEENLERLNSACDRVYNMYVTRRGDPFTIIDNHSTTLNNLLDGKSIEIPFTGEQEISVYVIA
jgi:hypothetical protein